MAPVTEHVFDKDYSKYGFHDKEEFVFKTEKGLSKEVVEQISRIKKEPGWMLKLRLRALEEFYKKPMPQWGANLNTINFDDIYYYIKPTNRQGNTWEDVPEYIKKTFDRLGIPEAERKFLGGVGAQYECLSGDTRIFTNPSGLKEIKSVKVGDKVFALNETIGEIKTAVVRGVMFKGEREVFKVKIGTKRIKATINHPFLALTHKKKPNSRRGRYKKEWRYLSDLKVGDLVAVAKQLPHKGKSYKLPQIVDFSVRHKKIRTPPYTNEDVMWFLGLYLGDGFIHKEKSKARVELAIPKQDIQLRKELIQIIENIFNIKASEIDKDRVTVYSTILARFIEKIGFGGKAKTKSIPDWVLSLPKNQLLAFLGGYLDSDGYVRNNFKNHDIIFTSVNKKILEDIKMITILCSLPTSEIHEFQSKHVYDKERIMTAYRLQVSGDIGIIASRSEKRFSRFGAKKYYHKFNSAKNTTFRKYVNDFIGFAKIESIEPAGIEPVYDIEVDNYHNFVAEGIIVHNSEVVYHKIREDLEKQGVVFLDMDGGLREYPDIVKKYFCSVIPYNDNKFAALNTAVWSGGSFVHIPAGVKVDLPLQAYFRINAQNMGQFERTLIITEPNSSVHYLEGCTAPIYSSDSLHSAVVELIAMEGSRLQYTTIQNWSNNVYNLVTKRAFAHKNATVFWVDGNLGCLAEGTKIFTNPGLKAIEEVMPGEKVITFNEKTKELEVRKVLATKFSGVQPTYRLILENGKREVIATKNHPFLAVQYNAHRAKKLGRYYFKWLPLEHLSEGTYLIVPKQLPDLGTPYQLKKPITTRIIKGSNQYGSEYLIDTSYKYKKVRIPELSTEDILWLFGFTIGDGNIEITKNKATGKNRFGKIIFSVPNRDSARDKVVKLMGNIFNLDIFWERKDKIAISYNSLIIAEFFKLNGIDGNAHTKRVPEWIFTLPVNQKKAFLAGYIEADGSIKKNTARLKTCNKELLEDLKSLAIGCGIEVNKIKKEIRAQKIAVKGYNYEEKEYTSYIMHISGLSKLRELFSSWNKERVPKTMFEHNTYWLTETRRIKMPYHLALYRITDIIPLGEKPTYDLEIEGSHNFIANGIIVHNSKITMKYPSVYLLGEGAKAEILSVAFAGKGQHQDAGGKILHFAPNTTSRITSKSVSKDGGRTTYRGLLHVAENCKNVKSHVTCDALILDEKSASDTVPYMEINEKNVNIEHEATVGKIGEEQLFYLMSRGLSQDQAMTMIVSGFMEPFTKELPLEYAIELNRLIAMNMEGSVG